MSTNSPQSATYLARLTPAGTAALATLTLANTPWSQLSRADAVLAAYVVPKQLR